MFSHGSSSSLSSSTSFRITSDRMTAHLSTSKGNLMRTSSIIPPSSDRPIGEVVDQYLKDKNLEDTQMFEHYDEALRAVWPQIFTSNPNAAIFLSISLFIEAAQTKGFAVTPEFLRRMKDEDEF